MLTWRNMECLYRHIHLTHFTQCTVGKSVGHNPGSNQPVVSCCVRIFYRSGAIIVPIPIPSVCVCTFKRNQSMRGGGSICQLMGATKEKGKNNKMGKAKKETETKQKRHLSVCVWESFIYGRQCCRWKHWSQYDWKTMAAHIDERKRFSSLLFLFYFIFLSVPLAVLLCGCWWMVGCPAADGYLSFPPECVCGVAQNAHRLNSPSPHGFTL